MAKKPKPIWDREPPKGKSKPLTKTQKRSAMAMSAKAGRPYPNLVDNIAAARPKKKR